MKSVTSIVLLIGVIRIPRNSAILDVMKRLFQLTEFYVILNEVGQTMFFQCNGE